MAIPNGIADAFGQDESPIIFLFRYHFGSFIADVMVAVAFTAFLSALLANVAVCTRLIYSLSRDRMLPAWPLLQRVSPVTRTPLYVIGLVGAIALLLNFLSEGIVTRIVSIVAVCYYGTYVFTMAGAIWAARKGRMPSLPAGTGYADLGRWLIPVAVVGVAFSLFIMAYLTLPEVNHTAGTYSLYAFLVGLLWWVAYLFRKIRAGEAGPPAVAAGEETPTEHRIAGESVEVG
jgi:amino acid transporter